MNPIWKKLQNRHAGSWALVGGGAAAAVMWYAADLGYTSMPPMWLIWLVACAVAVALNHLTPNENDA